MHFTRGVAAAFLLALLGSRGIPAGEPPARPLILLTNDDGASAPGLAAVFLELERLGDVVVAAPAANSSGASQSVALQGKIRVSVLSRGDLLGAEKHAAFPPPSGAAQPEIFKIEAPPATCAHLAIEKLSRGRKFDLAVSGINRGQNVGTDAGLSGTLGAARLAADLGIPALALSLHYSSGEFPAAAAAAMPLVRRLLERGRDGSAGAAAPLHALFLNVNFPAGKPEAWRQPLLVVPGGRGFDLTYRPETAPAGELLFTPVLGLHPGPFPVGSDSAALADGHPAVTVLPAGAEAGLAGDLRTWEFFLRRPHRRDF